MIKTSLPLVLVLAACSSKSEPVAAPKTVENTKPAESPKAPTDDAPFRIAYAARGERIVPMGCVSNIGDHLLIMVGREAAKDPCAFDGEDDYDLAFELAPDKQVPTVGHSTKTDLEIAIRGHEAKVPVAITVAKQEGKNLWVTIRPTAVLPEGLASVGGTMRIDLATADGAYSGKEPTHTWRKTDENKGIN